jgi:hypothetical protein
MIQAYSLKPGFIKNLLGGKFNTINVGIAICHLQIAAEHFGRKTAIVFEEEKDRKPPRDSEYVVSLKIE